MAKKKISQLVAVSSLDGNEPIPLVQGGVTKKATINQIVSFIGGAFINGSGTAGRLSKFVDGDTIGNSIVSESGSVISVAGSFETNTTGYTIIAGNSSQNRTVKIGTGSTFEGSIQATLTNGTAWDLHINPEGGQIITNSATDTGEHFIIGGSARVNGGIISYSGTGRALTLQKNSAFTGNFYIDYLNSGGTSLAYVGFGSGGNNKFQVYNTLDTLDLYSGTSVFSIGHNTSESTLNTTLRLTAGNTLSISQGDMYIQTGGYGILSPDANRLIEIRNGEAKINGTAESNGFIVGNGEYYKATRSSGGLVVDVLGIESGTDNTRLLITGDFNIKNGSNNTLMNMTANGITKFVSTSGAYNTALYKFEDGWSVSSLKFTNPIGTFALQAYAQDNPSYYLPLVLNNQGGNVLIGTATDAGYKLDVNGSINSGSIISAGLFNFRSDNTIGNSATIGKFSTLTGGAMDFELAFTRSANGAGAYYAIQSVEQGVAFRNIVLNQSGGNVLIGTTTDDGVNKLQVSGNTYLNGILTAIGLNDESIRVATTGAINAASVIIENGSGTASLGYSYTRYVNSKTSPQDWRVGTYGNDNLSFVNATNGTTPLIISTTGAATFSSSVTAGGNLIVGGTYTGLSAANRGYLSLNGTTDNIIVFSNNSSAKGYLFHDGTHLEILNATATGKLKFYTNSALAIEVLSSLDVIFSETIKTGTPDSGTAVPWKLGSVISSGGQSLDTGRYVEVEIDGTFYKLALLN